MIDDTRKIAVSRLGDTIRVAGTAEMAGYDTGLDQRHLTRAVRRPWCSRYEELFPGVADTSPTPTSGPACGPSTPRQHSPTSAAASVANLWVNAGHGTLGWTHGAGSGRALAELMSGLPTGAGLRLPTASEPGFTGLPLMAAA